jgi:glutaredoxin
MFLLYYKNDCHYSSNSLNLMKTLGIEYEPILVDDNNQNIKNQLKNKFMHTTMPAIFYLNKVDKVASRTKMVMIICKNWWM